MNNSNYESSKIVLDFPGFRGLEEGPPHGGQIIFKIGACAPKGNMHKNEAAKNLAMVAPIVYSQLAKF